MALAASNGPAALMASELMARGRESAAALEALLQGASSSTSAPATHGGLRELAVQILCCLDRALAALHGEGAVDDDATGGGKKRRPPPGAAGQARPKRRARATGGAEMPMRVEKRSTPEDGFLWRKYGQKDIQNSKYPRTYFRCSYKHDNGCKATRQVQQSEDDPSVYVVTYFGEHTCGTAVEAEKSQHSSFISFGSAGSGSPWLSSSDDDVVRSNSSQVSRAVSWPVEDGGDQKANVFSVDSVMAPPAEPSLPADDDVSRASQDLEALLSYFDWDCSGDSLFDMDLVNFDAIALIQ